MNQGWGWCIWLRVMNINQGLSGSFFFVNRWRKATPLLLRLAWAVSKLKVFLVKPGWSVWINKWISLMGRFGRGPECRVFHPNVSMANMIRHGIWWQSCCCESFSYICTKYIVVKCTNIAQMWTDICKLVTSGWIFSDVPDPPRFLNVESVYHDSIMLTWKPPMNDGGGFITQYIVEKREEDMTSWLRCCTTR